MSTATQPGALASTPPAPAPAATLGGAILGDATRQARSLGIQHLRASIVDLDTMNLLSSWSLGESSEVGDFGDNPTVRPVDTLQPGAGARIADMANRAESDAPPVRISPRRWFVAWRLGGRFAAVTEVQYLARRDAIDAPEASLIRLLGNSLIRSGLRPSQAAPAAADASQALPTWSHADRRARVRRPLPTWLAPVVLGAGSLLLAWQALYAVPRSSDILQQQQAELKQMRTSTQSTISHGLAVALATGDYGEVQAELSLYESHGYFKSAVVTNSKQRVVALVGTTGRQRIGDEVVPEFAEQAQTLDLKAGSEAVGRLYALGTPSGLEEPPRAMVIVAGLGLLATLGGLGIAALPYWWQWRRRRS